MAELKQLIVAEAGRLDKVLADGLELSRREALRLLENGLVSLNGHQLSFKDKGRTLEIGWALEVEPFTHLNKILPQAELKLPILYEGQGFVTVDKPAEMPVRPKHAGEGGTVLNALVARFPELQGVGEGGLRSGVVHRLDTDTSGALAVAIEQQAWVKLRNAFSTHRTTKIYRAIVVGQPEAKGRLELPLTVSQHSPAKVSVTEGGWPCNLSWQVLERLDGHSLIDVQLGTGFLHQIRAIFAHLGHPVLGDALYGEASPLTKRQMLHAGRLEVLGVMAESPLPRDMAGVLRGLRS